MFAHLSHCGWGLLSEEILAKLPSVDVQKIDADLHVVPKFCEGLSIM